MNIPSLFRPSRTLRSAACALVALSSPCAVGAAETATRTESEQSTSTAAQQARSFSATFSQPVALNYLVHLPAAYGEDRNTSWPLLLFLHGIGERGTDPQAVKRHGPPSFLDNRPDFPFVVVSPQCPPGGWWDNNALLPLLDHVLKEYNVDPDRVYLTGLSMGGFGTWALAQAYPERFAAIAPVCGGGNPFLAERLARVPVWAFHGAKDTVVDPRESVRMVEAMQKAEADEIRLTIYPEATHNSWTQTYNNQDLYDWLLKHRRGQPVEGSE